MPAATAAAAAAAAAAGSAAAAPAPAAVGLGWDYGSLDRIHPLQVCPLCHRVIDLAGWLACCCRRL
jgi:hypothetical protein